MSFLSVQQKHIAATMCTEWSAAVISNDRWKDSIYGVVVEEYEIEIQPEFESRSSECQTDPLWDKYILVLGCSGHPGIPKGSFSVLSIIQGELTELGILMKRLFSPYTQPIIFCRCRSLGTRPSFCAYILSFTSQPGYERGLCVT